MIQQLIPQKESSTCYSKSWSREGEEEEEEEELIDAVG
jgi:hypothetical protein